MSARKRIAASSSNGEMSLVELLCLFEPPYTHSKQTEVVQLMRGSAEACERNIKQWKAMWETYDYMIYKHPTYMKDIIPYMTESMQKQSAAVISSMELFRDDLRMLHEANGSLRGQHKRKSRSRSRSRKTLSK